MRMYTRKLVLAAALLCGVQTVAFAQSTYELGSVLSPSQVTALGNLASFNIGNATFRILPPGQSSGGNVINSQGRVGRSEGDVLISGIPTADAKKLLVPYQSSIVSTKEYESLRMVSARFSNLTDAARARNEIASAHPEATVTLPIVFSLPRPR